MSFPFSCMHNRYSKIVSVVTWDAHGTQPRQRRRMEATLTPRCTTSHRHRHGHQARQLPLLKYDTSSVGYTELAGRARSPVHTVCTGRNSPQRHISSLQINVLQTTDGADRTLARKQSALPPPARSSRPHVMLPCWLSFDSGRLVSLAFFVGFVGHGTTRLSERDLCLCQRPLTGSGNRTFLCLVKDSITSMGTRICSQLTCIAMPRSEDGELSRFVLCLGLDPGDSE